MTSHESSCLLGFFLCFSCFGTESEGNIVTVGIVQEILNFFSIFRTFLHWLLIHLQRVVINDLLYFLRYFRKSERLQIHNVVEVRKKKIGKFNQVESSRRRRLS